MTDSGGAPALKEIFDRSRMRQIAAQAAEVYPAFDRARFLALATSGLDELGIMQRMRLVATSLRETLPDAFPDAAPLVVALGPHIGHSFAAISLSEYVALYGQDHHALSMDALKQLTRYGSSEFAIRHFLQRDFARTLAVMLDWADDDDEHVRRLASEGSRPRLPWSFQLKQPLTDPSLTWPILDRLRADPSLYVRKSVANHLNDVSKDNPDWLIGKLDEWPRDRQETSWIMRQALRTLVKKGDARALALQGASGKAEVIMLGFTITPQQIKLGDRITISGALRSTSKATQRLVIDYAVHYVKKNGAASRKVFKLREATLDAGAELPLVISQTVRDFTTRKHNAGFHRVELIVNGQTLAESGFHLHM